MSGARWRWIWVFGVVQGVGFRAHTRQRALGLGLSGTVRNRVDGSVEVCAEGPPEALDALLDACRVGPPQAQVERIETREGPAEGGLSAFSVVRGG